MSAFPTTAEDVSAPWLEAQLRRCGALREGKITGLDWKRVGVGQVGDSVRYAIQYDRAGAGPASLVAKLPSVDATSRQTAASLGLYMRETRFYRELRPLLQMRAPQCYSSELDESGANFILLLEDLGPARGGDQLAGCGVQDAREAMRQAAAMHAPSWNLPAVVNSGWLRRSEDFITQIVTLYPKATEIFRERYAGIIAPDLLQLAADMSDCCNLYMRRQTPDNCFVHADFRLDNMLFDIKGGAEPIAILDYQPSFVGHGLTDVAFFLGCGTGSALRRPHEQELLELYCAEMSRRGVKLGVKDIWDEYRIGGCHGLMMAVFSTAFVQRTERGDQSFRSMATGAGELMLDHDSLGALRSWAARSQ